ncbi:MAG TPA: hypothetical protein PKK83_20825, partial [Polyangiaceae bacterium]|nr:hypothetical protein [Polyangiaceae bacterium]
GGPGGSGGSAEEGGGAGSGGGGGGTGGTGQAGTGAQAGSGLGGMAATTSSRNDDDGCGCRFVHREANMSMVWLTVLGLLGWRARRKYSKIIN